MPALKVCFVTSELAPYAKVGGLADVSAGLPPALRRAGHDVRVFVPLYAEAMRRGHPLTPLAGLQEIPVTLGSRRFTFDVLAPADEGPGSGTCFLRCAPLYERPGVYTEDPDEHLRFLLLSRGALECCQRLGWAPDIVHCHDWQTAILPLLLRTAYAWDRLFADTRTVLTIHNLAYQGIFPAGVVPSLGLGDGASLLHHDDLRAGRLNFLKTGIMYAGALTTVSETYAREIQTPEFGEGLDPLLRRRAADLVGILNGVDTETWNPATDPWLASRYTAEEPGGKRANREALLRRVGLPSAPGALLVGIVSRLAGQKGFDLLFDVLPERLAEGRLRLVVLGSGERRYEEFFQGLAARWPERAAFREGYDDPLAHLIEGGCDAFLMPSRYEPCGLNQMYSLLYGTVPIVRRTGGLADSVRAYDPVTGEGNGVVFEHYTPAGARWALGRALELWDDAASWWRMMRNGMRSDFSWDARVPRYVGVYERLVRPRAIARA